MLVTALLLALTPGSGTARAQENQQVGAIRGTVYDRDFGVPLQGVRVRLVEVQREAVSSKDGVFAFSQVPAGSWTLIFTKDGYERWIVPNVVVTPGRLTDVRADLASEVFEMEELVVTGVELMDDSEIAALEIRAESVTLQDAISSELISRAGVSDVGGALKLVVGASIVEGKYATVRGLSDRYTGTTLNGVRVPSADPRRRAVQVDLFPTGTLDNITVTKSFTPDLHGDFTGGGVDIRTKSVPEEPILSVSVSQEHNSEATGNGEFLTYEGGGSAPFGAGNGGRDIPSFASRRLPGVPAASTNPTLQEMEDAVTYDHLVRSFDPVMGVETESPGPNDGVSAVFGDSRAFGIGRSMGFVGAVTWSHKYDSYEEGQNNDGVVSVASDGLTLFKERTDSRGADQVLLGALGSIALKPGDDHEYKLQVVHNQSTTDEARYQEEQVSDAEVEQNHSLIYTERTVTSVQASGEHAYGGGSHLDWVAARNYTEQNEPDVRFFRNRFSLQNFAGFVPTGTTPAQVTRRMWREGEETNYEGAMNVQAPFRQWSGLDGSFKAGFYVESTDRTYTQNSYFYSFTAQRGSIFDPRVSENNAKGQYMGNSRDDLWTDVFLDSDRIGLAQNNPPAPNQLLWVIEGLPRSDVNYDGTQEIDAAYAMAELPLLPRLKAVFGARFERTDLSIIPVNEAFGVIDTIKTLPGGNRVIFPIPQQEAITHIRDESVLPSLGLIYEILPSMSLRAGWSRTLARPTFRELAPVVSQEFIAGEEFIGNPDLTLSSITNYDLRWEWFPRSGEVLAASVFYKELKDPIELISFVAAGGSFVSPVNYQTGELQGAEIEARSSLDVFSERLKGFSAGINYTWLDSQVDVPEEEQEGLASFGLDEATRRLQGQPEYILNVSLTYDNERTGTEAGVFYNLIGEVLLTGAAVSSDASPNVFEQPSGNLDLTLSQKLREGWSLSFKATNMLGDDRSTIYRTPSGDEAVKTLRDVGTRYSISAKWSL